MTVFEIRYPLSPDAQKGNLWDFDLVEVASKHTSLRTCLLRQPGAHPLWHDYYVSLIHLREVPGVDAAVLDHPDSTHEIFLFALDPNHNNQPVENGVRLLMPANLTVQLRRLDDTQAMNVFRAFLLVLSAGALPADTDFRSAQVAMLDKLNSAALEAN